MRVLVAEDHASLARSIAKAMREAGFAADVAGTGDDALALMQAAPYDVTILDLMLPGRDGLSVLRAARAGGFNGSVLVLTAKAAVDDRVALLDAGADDYLVKPFALAELLARTRALVRRRYEQAGREIRIGSVVVDTSARRVFVGGADVQLSAREYAVLEVLVLHRGRIVSREQAFEHLYDFAAEPGSNVVEVHVSKIRKKLGAAGDSLIRTCRGVGYLVDDEAS